jgi:chemotaxis protein MotB
MQQNGLGKNQVTQVRGYADQMLRVPSNPFDPSNRRISVIVQYLDKGGEEPQAPAEKLPQAASPENAQKKE